MSREAEILVHPSLDESFCMAAAEAMALRKPVIAGLRTRGVREVLGYGTAGLLVDVKDPEAIADAMLRLAQDAGFRARVADAGYERVSQLYRLETVVAQYEHLYRRILQ
jgi:glycosyltransferase involved in cell wall biosynthesis